MNEHDRVNKILEILKDKAAFSAALNDLSDDEVEELQAAVENARDDYVEMRGWTTPYDELLDLVVNRAVFGAEDDAVKTPA